MSIEFYNPKSKPFGPLSNDYIYPLTVPGVTKKQKDTIYPSVTHYIYSKLLCKPTYQTSIRNARKLSVLREDYEAYQKDCKREITEEALYTAYSYKSEKNEAFRELLKSTQNKELIYESENILLGLNSEKEGENLIGKTLEKIRVEINKEDREKQKEKEYSQTRDNIYKIYMAINFLDNKMHRDDSSLNQYLNMTFNDILSENNVYLYQYQPKDVILENYDSGHLRNMEIIDQILQNSNTRDVAELFRKYNLRNLHSRLQDKIKDMVMKYYFINLISSRYPALPTEQVNFAAVQQIQKMGYNKRGEVRHKLNDLYQRGMLKDMENLPQLQEDISRLQEKLPSDDEINAAENFIMKDTPSTPEIIEEEPEIIEEEGSPTQNSGAISKFLNDLEEDSEFAVEDELKLPEVDDNSFENATEIVFNSDVSGKYGLFSPLHVSCMYLHTYNYPTVSHSLYACYFKQLIDSSGVSDSSWKLSHNLITLDTYTRSSLNIEDYVDIHSYNWVEIEKMLLCKTKKILFNQIATIKFNIFKFQEVLALTGNHKLIYADSYDECLKEFVGSWMETRRSYISQQQKQLVSENADVIALSQMFRDDKRLVEWIHTRSRDLVHTLCLLSHNTAIGAYAVHFVVNDLYTSCNFLESGDIYSLIRW
jgi:predicted NAD-dependent protein-ADP-ribosyltransferase YbiA (DUF1768 family)